MKRKGSSRPWRAADFFASLREQVQDATPEQIKAKMQAWAALFGRKPQRTQETA